VAHGKKIKPVSFCLLIIIINCAFATALDNQGVKTMDTKKIEEVLKKHAGDLLSIPGVTGTAIGLCDKKPCIKVYVLKKTPALYEKIPEWIEGYTVVIEETGEFKPLPEKQ
jgi:hypothetical protein